MKNKKILVTGGAGYIGSFTVQRLLKEGFEVVVVDNLEYGHPESLPQSGVCQLIKADIGDREALRQIFEKEKPAAIFHFAGYIVVAESSQEPAKYFENNLIKSKILLDEAVSKKVNSLVFSSSAAVYGQPRSVPIKEDDLKDPNSPYGETKYIFERMLHWYDQAYGLKSVSLRYFNASGASLEADKGEDHYPETHLIPRACLNALGVIGDFQLTCPRCKTADGTTIRDYIHVLDLATAHTAALHFLFEKKRTEVFNVGTGRGYSTLSVINEIEKVSSSKFNLQWGESRLGEPEELVADNQKIEEVLGWKPQYSDLKTIVKTAWEWHKSHPRGYREKH